MSEKITMEELARMVQGGFNELGDRIDRLESRIDPIEGKLASIDQKISAGAKDLAAIRFAITELAYRDEVLKLAERVEKIEVELGLKIKVNA